MRITLLLFLIVFSCSFVSAQTGKKIIGSLLDVEGLGIEGATVKLYSAIDTLVVSSSRAGDFRFEKVKSLEFHIQVSRFGYVPINISYKIKDSSDLYDLKAIIMKENPIELDEVTVSTTPKVLRNGDTTEFQTRHIALEKNALLEELLSKLPGMRIDFNGNLWLNGKSINKVRINGVDFFEGNVALALKNLPADLINKLQIIDDYGELAALTGIKEGEPERVLNLVVDEDRNKGFFSDLSIGGGTESSYHLQAAANYFNGAKQLELYGSKNNINAPAKRQIGVISMNVGQEKSGVNTNIGAGFQYADKWSEKLRGIINYTTGKEKRLLNSTTYSEQNFLGQGIINIAENGYHDVENNNNLRFTLQYKPNALTSIKLEPRMSISRFENRSSGGNLTQFFNNGSQKSIQSQLEDGVVIRNNNQVGGDFTFNRLLNGKGRNVYFSAVLNSSDRENEEEQESLLSLLNTNTVEQIRDSLQIQEIRGDNASFSSQLKLIYTEPIGAVGKLDVSVEQKYSRNTVNRSIYDALKGLSFVDSLSNSYQYSILENSLQLSYRHKFENVDINMGLRGVNNRLEGDQNNIQTLNKRNSMNFVPNALIQWRLLNGSQLALRMASKTQEPSFLQLNPISDRINPQNIISGNADLKTEFIHNASLEFKGGFQSMTFSNAVKFNYYQDRITVNTSLVMDEAGFIIRNAKYQNLSGDYSIGGSYSFDMIVAQGKYSIGLTGDLGWDTKRYYENQVERSTGTLRTLHAVNGYFKYNWLIVIPIVSYSYQKSSFSLLENSNNPLSTVALKTMLDARFKNNFLNATFIKEFNNGYGGGVERNPILIAISCGRSFKNRSSELSLTIHNLLDQNMNLKRVIQNNGFIDRSESSLGRYIMLTYSQKLSKFY